MIARDPHEADDLVQEVYLRLLQRGATESEYPRSRMGGLLRLLYLERRRKQQRRSHHEAIAGSELRGATVERDIELHDLRNVLESTIEGLGEPYRSVARASILEGLRSSEIARLLDAEASTVRTQLERARRRLRARLSERFSGLGLVAWQRALGGDEMAPLAVDPVDWAEGWVAPGRVSAGLVGALGLVGLGLLAWTAWAFLPTDGGPVSPSAPQGVAKGDTPSPAPPGNTAGTEGPRRPAPPLAAGQAESSDPPGGEQESDRLRGRILDLEGRGVEGLDVHLAPQETGIPWSRDGSEPRVRSGEGGAFSLPSPPEAGRWLAFGEDYVTVASPLFFVGQGMPITVIVGRRTELAGWVLHEDGTPAKGARVEAGLPREAWERIRPDGQHYTLDRWSTRSAEDGSFGFAGLPAAPELVLQATLDGFPEVEAIPFENGPSPGPWTLVLARPSETPPEVPREGVVVDPLGAPVGGAWVSWGDRSVRSDPSGAFVLPEGLDPEGVNLCAVALGFLPSETLRPAEGVSPEGKIRMVLGGPPGRVEGQVWDTDGSPLHGALVWTSDGTDFGVVEVPLGNQTALRHARVEDLAGRGDPAFHGMRSTTEGAFRLGGLLDRTYDVYAMHPRSLAVEVRRKVEPGELELDFRFGEAPGVLTGEIVDAKGEGIPGVHFRLGREVPFQYANKMSRVFYLDRFFDSGPSGEFRVEGVDLQDLRLDWRAPGVMDGRAVPIEGGDTPIRLRAQRQGTIRLHVADDVDPALLEVQDARGNGLRVYLDLPTVQVQHVTHQVHLEPGTTHWIGCTPEASRVRVRLGERLFEHDLLWPETGPLELELDAGGFSRGD